MREVSNVLVTGGLGFIGSAFMRFLFRTNAFTGRVVNLDLLTYAGNPDNVAGFVDESRYSFVRGDICDQQLVSRLCQEHAIDTIVNFAAESHVDRSIAGPGVFIQTNIVGTYSLLEVVRSFPSIHFHHVSTDEVYGSLGITGAFDEQSPYRPNSPYSASKAASDHLVRSYAHTFGISTTISNCSNNYGPFQFPEKLIPLMILNAVERKPLPVYGDGLNIRDWLYVDDHVEAIWTVICEGDRGATYNIGGKNEWTNIAIVEKIADLLGRIQREEPGQFRSLITFVKDRPGHDRRYAIDSNKLTNQLGWRARHDFEAGLDETIRWYLRNSQWISRVKTGAYRQWIKKNYDER
ncbi:MAG: dTDP-glucose 4,6-dehydratase [Deltaproteobacteria bacterium]|nr:dTDP-glucose 4,6-dehydratase [Deltaproteobacteria bacterium]